MDVERIIEDIEQLQEMFQAPDIRPLSASDISAADRRHDEMLPIALGSGCSSILVSAAEPNPQSYKWVKETANVVRESNTRHPEVQTPAG
jgi:hypothetical protein